ncbi:DUF1294 domain-containing protein [Paenibacillus allorhizosphaerae]|uniref:DUF1294 domain-containing protein n=1 Tax=Paenibacillus allorhizosphaerae TaxID=2849866 RepID=A0ABM8VDA5_9BACL|nr:DUF1294 domain-containing protein [Paenibacillus allorhizosphaerae]CAG7624879.1 hypothetical protein PAECIP111802_01109 [Paenibacillus allorhizosphaerae]
MKLLFIYLLGMNMAVFFLMGHDKSKARQGRRRVPERRLFGLSAAGGALGAWIGMRVWRHKTKHTSFQLGIPALLLFNAAAVYALIRYVLPLT